MDCYHIWHLLSQQICLEVAFYKANQKMLLDVDELKLRLRRQRIVPDRFCNFFTDMIFLVVHNCQNIDISPGSGQANTLAQLLHFSIRDCLSRWSRFTIDRVLVSDLAKPAKDTMLEILNLLLFLRRKNSFMILLFLFSLSF